jgi:hypothetical protein
MMIDIGAMFSKVSGSHSCGNDKSVSSVKTSSRSRDAALLLVLGFLVQFLETCFRGYENVREPIHHLLRDDQSQ